MKVKQFILALYIFSTITFVQNQVNAQSYPNEYFRNPLDIPLVLSGTFGELRGSHFHSGIDIKTLQVTGKNVYASAQGYVSRIKVSPAGFGKAIYINHPNGYTTVYGHLKKFNSQINSFIRKKQYGKQSFAVDAHLDPGEIIVSKGEMIAWSGNSGSSGGPHLHFEIRQSNGQKPINPLLFGFGVKDDLPPIISWIKLYPHGKNATINNQNKTIEFSPNKVGNKYFVKAPFDTINVSGDIFFGVNTIDRQNAAQNNNGDYSVSFFVDENEIFTKQMESFYFHETRFLNSLIDYADYKKRKRRYQRSFIQPNNKLEVYKRIKNQGVFSFIDNETHKVKCVVKDIEGNTSVVEFFVKSEVPNLTGQDFIIVPEGKELFWYDEENTFSDEGLRLYLPKDALYDSLYFSYNRLPKKENCYAPTHQIHYDFVPVHKYFTLKIKTENLPENLISKAFICRITNNGKIKYANGKYKNGWIIGDVRSFGKYSVAIDINKPTIKAVNIYNNKNIKSQQTIKMKISDDLTGIKTYRGTLNGKWILMEYDPKTSSLIYYKDWRCVSGTNDFKLVVTDNKDNRSEYSAKLFN